MQAVNNLDDPVLDVYRHLRDRDLKCRAGLFIAEGLEVVRRLLHSGITVHSLLVTTQKLQRLSPDLHAGLRVFVASVPQMEEIAGFTIHRGAVACGFRPAPLTFDDALRIASSTDLIVALENIIDAQNIGVIVRNAAAFGAGLIVTSRCCDPLYRRAVRVSMGNVFRLPHYATENLPGVLHAFRERSGHRIIAAVTDRDAVPLSRAQPGDRRLLLFGSEGEGLSPATRAQADEAVVVPMSPGSDSVNVAVASGIFLHHYAAVPPVGDWTTSAGT